MSGKLLAFRMAEARRNADILRARRDPAYFNEYAIPHEKTGKPIVNAQFHRDWHDFFSRVRYGIISASVELGKTQSISIGRAIWEIGNDPTLRMAIICATDKATVKVGRAIRRHIDRNPRVREVFPDLRRSDLRGDPWTAFDMVVHGSGGSAKDPSIQCRTVRSEDVLGSRLDLVLVDDILNTLNTRTMLARDNLEEWFEDVIITRVYDDIQTGVYGRIFLIGNPWNADDLMARLARLEGWEMMVTPIVINPDDPVESWIMQWPAAWNHERLMARRAIMHPRRFARKYLCRVLSDEIRRFRKAWLDHMFEQGKGRILLERQPRTLGAPMRCFTGADFGIGKGKSHAKTVFFTIAIEPRPPHRRIVVHIEAGRWTGPEILKRAASICRRFDSELCSESNQAQTWMGDFAEDFEGIAVLQLNTGNNKWSEDYGVESIAVEMKAGKWIAPTGADDGAPATTVTTSWPTEYDELAEWAQECYDFDPEDHTGDRLMASWKAREGARLWLRDRFQESNHMTR